MDRACARGHGVCEPLHARKLQGVADAVLSCSTDVSARTRCAASAMDDRFMSKLTVGVPRPRAGTDWLRSVNFRDRMSAAAGTCRSLPARASDRCASKYLPDEGSQAATWPMLILELASATAYVHGRGSVPTPFADVRQSSRMTTEGAGAEGASTRGLNKKGPTLLKAQPLYLPS